MFIVLLLLQMVSWQSVQERSTKHPSGLWWWQWVISGQNEWELSWKICHLICVSLEGHPRGLVYWYMITVHRASSKKVYWYMITVHGASSKKLCNWVPRCLSVFLEFVCCGIFIYSYLLLCPCKCRYWVNTPIIDYALQKTASVCRNLCNLAIPRTDQSISSWLLLYSIYLLPDCFLHSTCTVH